MKSIKKIVIFVFFMFIMLTNSFVMQAESETLPEDNFIVESIDGTDGVVIRGYTGPINVENPRIPNEIGGKPVLEIESAQGEKGVFQDSSFRGTVYFGKDLRKLGSFSFKGEKGIKSIVAPGLKELGQYSLEWTELEELNLPELEKIGQGAFNHATIESLTLGKIHTLDRSIFGYGGGTFTATVKELNLPGTKKLNNNMFQGITTIDKLELPKLEEIGYKAFHGFELSELNLPQVHKINDDAFGEAKIKTLIMNNLNTLSTSYFGYSDSDGNYHSTAKIEKIVAEKVKIVEEQTFFENQSIQVIKIPNVTKIDDFAFYNAKNIHTINSDKPKGIDLPNVQEIGDFAFYHVNQIKELHLPSVEKIGNSAFGYASSLEKVDMPNVVEVGSNAFRDAWNAENPNTILNSFFNHSVPAYNYEWHTFLIPIFNENRPEKDYIISADNHFSVGQGIVVEEGLYGSEIHYTDDKHHVFILNPSKEGAIPAYIKKEIEPNLLEDEEFIYPRMNFSTGDDIENQFLTGFDSKQNAFYCVDSRVDFESGVYKSHEVKDRVYVQEIANSQLVEENGQTVIFEVYSPQKDILDEKPKEYRYSYSSTLLSKVIYHANELLKEHNLLHMGDAASIVHLIASNSEIDGMLDLDETNFVEIVRQTSLYLDAGDSEKTGLVTIFGEDFFDALFNKVQNDTRDYTNLMYYRPVEHKFSNDADRSAETDEFYNQNLVKPGEPVNEKTTVEVSKKWVGGQALGRPGIIVELLRDGQKLEEVKLNEDNGWQHTWTELDKTNALGKKYEYSVKEVPVDNFKSSVIGNQDEGFVLTNTYQSPKTSVEVSKEWKDSIDDEHPAIIVELLRNNEKIKEIELSEENDWKYTWTNLDKTDEFGQVYNYTVQEQEVEGYVSNIQGDQESGFKIINTLEEPKKPETNKRDLRIEKIWLVEDEDTLPPITVQLFRNGELFDEVVLDGSENWTYIWLDLDRVDDQGNEYIYTIKELVPEAYRSIVEGDMDCGFIVINAPITPSKPTENKLEISINKVWLVNEKVDLPTITIQLLRNGEVFDQVTLDGSEDWKHVWTDLDRFDDKGNPYLYDIRELVPSGYESKIVGSMNDNFVVINIEKPSDPKPEKPIAPKPEKPTDPKPEKPIEPKPENPIDSKQEDSLIPETSVPSLPATGLNSPLLNYSLSIFVTGLILIILNKKD